MDAVLREHPGLASCAVRCRRCGIRFLTHPRNANRQDLCCEFGCRECQRRERANARSQKHYQTDQGWRKKKLLNGKRRAAAAEGKQEASPASAPSDTALADGETFCSDPSLSVEPASELPSPPSDPATPVALEEASPEDVQLSLGGFALDEATLVNSSMLQYLAMVASLLEGCTIRPEELLHRLRKTMRQRSFDRLPRREYVLRFLDQHPP